VELSIKVIFAVSWSNDFDQSLINRPIRARMGHFLTAFLAGQHKDCEVLAVKVERIE
jgi:hypothetical protein